MMERMWSKENILLMLVGVQTGKTTLEINIVVSQEIVNQSTSRSTCTNPGHMTTGCSVILQGHLLNYVHSSIIHNIKKLEMTYMPLNQRMDKGNTVHLQMVYLLHSCKKMTP